MGQKSWISIKTLKMTKALDLKLSTLTNLHGKTFTIYCFLASLCITGLSCSSKPNSGTLKRQVFSRKKAVFAGPYDDCLITPKY